MFYFYNIVVVVVVVVAAAVVVAVDFSYNVDVADVNFFFGCNVNIDFND